MADLMVQDGSHPLTNGGTALYGWGWAGLGYGTP